MLLLTGLLSILFLLLFSVRVISLFWLVFSFLIWFTFSTLVVVLFSNLFDELFSLKFVYDLELEIKSDFTFGIGITLLLSAFTSLSILVFLFWWLSIFILVFSILSFLLLIIGGEGLFFLSSLEIKFLLNCSKSWYGPLRLLFWKLSSLFPLILSKLICFNLFLKNLSAIFSALALSIFTSSAYLSFFALVLINLLLILPNSIFFILILWTKFKDFPLSKISSISFSSLWVWSFLNFPKISVSSSSIELSTSFATSFIVGLRIFVSFFSISWLSSEKSSKVFFRELIIFE